MKLLFRGVFKWIQQLTETCVGQRLLHAEGYVGNGEDGDKGRDDDNDEGNC